MKFRLLTTGHHTAAINMAIDEVVLNALSQNESSPTLRLYGWNPPAISIGYFQSLAEEVDLEKCKEQGVETVRRITGGGAVLHEHEITYSIHIPESSNMTPSGILESYEKICSGVIRGLGHLGVHAQFAPLNDIVVVGEHGLQKISGNAQTRKRGIILQHGTILLKVDVEKMFSLLKVPDEKLKGKLIDDVKKRVTSLSLILGRDCTFDEAQDALLKGFTQEFSEWTFEPSTLSTDELKNAEELAETKYKLSTWNNSR